MQILFLLVLFYLGVMKLEATKFRPREVVKHVLQTAAASLQKILTLEGHIADDVPIEVRTSMSFPATSFLRFVFSLLLPSLKKLLSFLHAIL